MTARISTLSGLMAALLTLAASGPALAQPVQQPVEDARLHDLRQVNLCQLRIGGFMALTAPVNKPTQADLDLMDEVYAVADRLIYESETLAKQVGPEAEKRLNDALMVTWYEGLKHGDGQPDKAAILRADLRPGLRDCIARAQTLVDRPR